ncbi:MAG: tetraacyldisaccharide 4'-kinase [Synergistaceae bacterium]|nr:tetraacyldisaccharide 4'-kinase [Synergistaceae bacterium]
MSFRETPRGELFLKNIWSFLRGLGNSVMRSYMAYVQGERRKSPFPALLWPLFFVPASWVAGLWISITDFLYRHGLRRITEPSIPVISLGNLTYGGTNKTPFVEMLCRMMKSRDVSVGIVSRGYGGRQANARVIAGGEFVGGSGRADRLSVGDEPLLLSSRLPDVPVAVSRDRMRGLKELERRGIRLAVADDAFQHRKMARDADVVLIDAACPFGNGRVIPAGVLREPPSALRRAHVVVLTKADQVSPEELGALRWKLAGFVPDERIFTARLAVVEWALWSRDSRSESSGFRPFVGDARGLRVMAFSAIGNSASFVRTLEQEGVRVAGERRFRDHHSYSTLDLEALFRQMTACEAKFLTCTEKDIYNLPPRRTREEIPPLLVPRVATALDEPERFLGVLVDCLRPRLVVASNGYGEDAIGVLLAKKLRTVFPSAEVLSFPLVGQGEPYKAQGFSVASTPSITPSGGVLKYRLRDLWGDIRAGLFGHIRDQQGAWRGLAHRVRTPICVGDVYLLLHTVWGQGIAPLFVATAKTVYLSGHWRLERFIIRRHCRRAWTRDGDSAVQLTASGADALYAGNPIMDLLGGGPIEDLFPARLDRPKVLLLPGSRDRAYEDVRLLLEAVELLQSQILCDYVMVLAPTISIGRLRTSCEGWLGGESLTKENASIRLHQGGVPEAAVGSQLLIGLGGTANQLCAGMGIPVLSIDEKGKRVQKKLLEDSEILVEPAPRALAAEALKILTTPELHEKMAQAGRARMGSPGALDDVVRYADVELGWSIRCEILEKLERVRDSG